MEIVKARLVTLQEKIGSLESAGLGNQVLDIESIKDQSIVSSIMYYAYHLRMYI